MEARPGEASILVARNTKAPYPPTLTMVKEAVKALDEKKGASVVAIKRYILHSYPGVDPIRLKYYLKQALVKGLEKGDLIRPLHSSAQGATGRFKLAAGKPRREKGQEKKKRLLTQGEKSGPLPEKKPKAQAPAEKGKKAKAKAGADKPRGKVGDKGEKAAAPRKMPKATPGKGPAEAPAKAKDKASQPESTEKASAPKASRAKAAAAAAGTAAAAPKEAAPKGPKTASKRQKPPKAEEEAGAQPPLAGKATVTGATTKEAKAKAGAAGKAKAAGGASKLGGKKGAARDKGKKLAGPEGS